MRTSRKLKKFNKKLNLNNWELSLYYLKKKTVSKKEKINKSWTNYKLDTKFIICPTFIYFLLF